MFMMRIQNYVNIVVIFVIPVRCYYLQEDDPLYHAFVQYENMVKDGCQIDVLPESIDWCDGKLNKRGKLPDNTVCQSIYKEDVKLLCRNGHWVPLKHGRSERSIAGAYRDHTNTTCERFCATNTSEQVGKSVPYFVFCPDSVTLYPVGNVYGNETDIQYTWEPPQAADSDGNITALFQIAGPESNSTFEGFSSPGINHVISYMATDNDNLNWTCSFVITVEIPTCPPIVHISNGNSSCTDVNSRYSKCSFSCNHGYFLNGSETTDCQENGTWSYGEDIPQCIAVTCDDPIVLNDTDVKVICDVNNDDNDTNSNSQFGSVCWMQCPNDFLLKNDVLLANTIQEITDYVNYLLELSASALTESNAAQELADDLDDVAAQLEYNATVAENHTLSLETSVQTAVDDLNNLKKMLNDTEISLTQKLLEYETAVEASGENVDELLDEVSSVNQTLVNLRGQIAEHESNLNTLTAQFTSAMKASVTARRVADQALLDAENAQASADEKKAIQERVALDAALALANFNNQSTYSIQTNIIVSSYSICNASGQWDTPGHPYCLDIDSPEMKCVPVVTHFLSVGQTSAVVTWSEPEVNDNSGNVTVYRVSGPPPGSRLEKGQYIVTYRAEDETGNMSPDCTMTINVDVYKCDDIMADIDNENVTVTCDSFDIGSTCTLSCIDYQVYDGTPNVTCKQNTSSLQMYWDFTDTPTCTAELCAEPKAPTNGVVECVTGTTDYENETTSNTTEDSGITCVFTCNDTYMLPYKTDSVFKCSDEGVWDSENFPTTCVETGEEKNAGYNFELQYEIQDTCSNEDTDSFLENWLDILAEEMTSYTACMMGYMCAVGETDTPRCSDLNKMVTIEFTISVTCEGEATSFPLEASCDLHKDWRSSLENSIKHSVEVDGVLGSSVVLATNWLLSSPTMVPQCPPGSILVGSYCALCAPGYYLSNEMDVCEPCPIGFYSNQTGSSNCSECSSERSTLNKGSTECIAKCAPGTYSSTGLEPCACCETGTFQSKWEQKTCNSCPVNTWTTGKTSDSEQDCVEYDLYFDADVFDIHITKIETEATIVFWFKYYYATQVIFGLYNENNDPVFQFDVSDEPQIIDGWDNVPLDVAMETGTWKMFGFTWDATSGDANVISVYSDGEEVKTLELSQMDEADKLKLSANNGTFLSCLSIVNRKADGNEMADVFADCANSLTGSIYTLDDLAVSRISAIKYTGSTCKASNASRYIDHCGINRCQNNGACVTNDVGYTCNCTEQYGGPFCEEELVHGNWSEWFEAAGCSVSCGNGTQLMYRFCNNPARSQYGNDCEGNSTEVVECIKKDCIECDPPEVESTETCDIADDNCEATCPPGYVMPRGQEKQKFQCGKSTNYVWMPVNRLPICVESRRPQGYSATLRFTFINQVPCEKQDAVRDKILEITRSQRCDTDNEACVSDVEIINCVGESTRRKRDTDTELLIVLSIPLLSNGTFNLAEYYSTSTMTESILEAVTAISVLEQTIQDILENPGQIKAEVEGVIYLVVGSSVIVTTTTNCNSGEVAVGAICAECQKGTVVSNGFCVYCGSGTYQSESGQSTCTICPGGGKTKTVGARSASECIPLPPEDPKAADLTTIIVVVVVVVLGLIVVILLSLIARRFYRSAKDREKYDMEADRISLYTDFPDIAYNVYFKRRQVLGFDEKGYPVIAKTKYQANGSVNQERPRRGSVDEGRTSQISKQGLQGNEDEHKGPFDYDPYALWAEETFVSPYDYPQEDTFDFPKIEHAVRYRVPGRKHLQNSYPLTQFGYTDNAHGRSRKNLPLPANIPIPKKLPQLMYRKPDKMSLTDILKNQYGFKRLQNKDEEGIPFPHVQEETPVPPLSLKKQPGKKIVTKGKGRKMSSASSAIQSTRSEDASSRARVKAPRTAKLFKASATIMSKLSNRSPRSTSAISPRSLTSTGTPSPRPATTIGRSPRSTDITEESPHPKPSRYIVPKDGPLPKHFPLPTKSVLKVSIPDEPRPDTGMTTGRKSVTIREDANITRPSTTATGLRPSTSGAPSRTHPQPTTDAVSARETMVAPYAAKPKSNFMSISDHPTPLPSDITEAYRPTSSFQRPITPAEHPRPVLHSGVTVKRSSEHAMFFPPTNISFEQQPPIAHTIRQMQPPPFLNKVKPEAGVRRNSSLKRARFVMGDHSEENSTNGSFFLTELPEELSASRASLAGSILSRTSKTSKKPSPPPDYMSSAQDKLIESSSMGNFEE